MEEKKPNVWKRVAIILIVLLVLQSIFVIWIFNIGSSVQRKENDCGISCDNDGYFYYYDVYDEICYCMNGNGDEVRKFIVK